MKSMPSLQIRELPDDVYQALAYRARRAGRSLSQQALAELRRMTQLGHRERRLDILEAIAQRARPVETDDWPVPEALVRQDRGR